MGRGGPCGSGKPLRLHPYAHAKGGVGIRVRVKTYRKNNQALFKAEGEKMKRLRRFKVALLTAAVLLQGSWALAQPTPDKAGEATQALPANMIPTMPPTRLIAQPEGTPLPPRDPSIADHWPPDLKQLLDNMLALFPKDRKTPPSLEEIEKKIGITLTERPLEDREYTWAHKYTVSGTRFMRPDLPERFRGSYYIRKAKPGESASHSLQLPISSLDRTAFCLNPYELAVYLGSEFVADNINGVHNGYAGHHFESAYVWGMFAWTKSGHYINKANAFSMDVGVGLEPSTGTIVQIGCVHTFEVSGSYKKEE